MQTSSVAAPHVNKYQTVEQLAAFGYKQPLVHPALSNLVIYTRAVKFTVFAARVRGEAQKGTGKRRSKSTPQDPAHEEKACVPVYAHEMCSFDESQVGVNPGREGLRFKAGFTSDPAELCAMGRRIAWPSCGKPNLLSTISTS